VVPSSPDFRRSVIEGILNIEDVRKMYELMMGRNINMVVIYMEKEIFHCFDFFFFFFFFLLSAQVSELSITGRDQTRYTVHADFCMFPQSCDLRTETAGSL
jgi:hypothetical protein